MTEKEILNILKSVNYASLFIIQGKQITKFGPGEWAWLHQLRSLDEEQRTALEKKIEVLKTRIA